MKCKYCDGTGTSNWCVNGCFKPCEYCDGTGEIEVTNEEYIRTCSTEELAKLIYKIAVTDVLMDRFFTAEMVNAEIVNEHIGIKEAEAWLKEIHE